MRQQSKSGTSTRCSIHPPGLRPGRRWPLRRRYQRRLPPSRQRHLHHLRRRHRHPPRRQNASLEILTRGSDHEVSAEPLARHRPNRPTGHSHLPWHRTGLQIVLALCSFALPVLLMPLAGAESRTDLWMRAGQDHHGDREKPARIGHRSSKEGRLRPPERIVASHSCSEPMRSRAPDAPPSDQRVPPVFLHIQDLLPADRLRPRRWCTQARTSDTASRGTSTSAATRYTLM